MSLFLRFAVLLLFAVAGAGAGLAGEADQGATRATDSPLVIFVGDSVTAGIGVEAPFPALLDRINAGCSGATTWDFLRPRRVFELSYCFVNGAYQERVSPSMPVPIAHILLGANDAAGIWEPRLTGPIELRENLLNLIARLRLDGARWIFISVTPVACASEPVDVVARHVWFRQEIHRLVEEQPRVWLGGDFSDLGKVAGRDALADCIHPSQEGHRYIASVLEERMAFAVRFERFWARVRAARR